MNALGVVPARCSACGEAAPLFAVLVQTRTQLRTTVEVQLCVRCALPVVEAVNAAHTAETERTSAELEAELQRIIERDGQP